MPKLPAPPASSPAVRAVMQGNRNRDTRPEVAVRSQLNVRGLRFRKHVSVLPGSRVTADVVFRALRCSSTAASGTDAPSTGEALGRTRSTGQRSSSGTANGRRGPTTPSETAAGLWCGPGNTRALTRSRTASHPRFPVNERPNSARPREPPSCPHPEALQGSVRSRRSHLDRKSVV